MPTPRYPKVPPLIFPPCCPKCYRRLVPVFVPIVANGVVVRVELRRDVRACDGCLRVWVGRPWLGPIPGPLWFHHDDRPRQLPPSAEATRRRTPVVGWRDFAREHRGDIFDVDGRLTVVAAEWQAGAV